MVFMLTLIMTMLHLNLRRLGKEVFRIVYNTKYNGVQLLDGTFDAEIMAGSNIGEELNLIIDGLRLESTITGRVDPIGGSLYELVNISRGTGSSNFDTPISAQAYGQTLEFQHPVGTATTSTASRYIGGGFQNGDFENVTITTSGTVDSFSGWEAHRQQVMLGPNPDILQSTTTLTANETTGTISADETVLSSIKTFSTLQHPQEVHFPYQILATETYSPLLITEMALSI